MKITTKQAKGIEAMVVDYAPKVAEAITKAIQANAVHKRQATVSLSIKVNRDAEKSALINVHAQVKSTVPKTSHEDLKAWSMIEVAFTADCEEDEGQQKLETG